MWGGVRKRDINGKVRVREGVWPLQGVCRVVPPPLSNEISTICDFHSNCREIPMLANLKFQKPTPHSFVCRIILAIELENFVQRAHPLQIVERSAVFKRPNYSKRNTNHIDHKLKKSVDELQQKRAIMGCKMSREIKQTV